ncbi:MAG: hypothetical protein K5871_08955 [Lachnospiraceae bacterium]|nr:hypothetical protein [Lachnospiraceae bacterium]
MKKILLKILVYSAVFFIFLLIFGKMASREQVNNTVDMDPASQPVIYLSIGDITYNMLRGYSESRNLSYERNTLSYLDADRKLPFVISTFGQKISSASYELRNIEDGRLIEEGDTELSLNMIGNPEGTISLKDLIIPNAEYMLSIKLTLEDERELFYYTRVISGDNDLAYEKLSYAKFFHECLFDKREAEKIKKHLETNSSLNDNSTFAYVDIHSSFSQITYGDLGVSPYGDPLIYLKEDNGTNATVCIDYMLRDGYGSDLTAYMAHEAITVRYTDKAVYIMSYVRTMEEITNPLNMCVNDKIVLGIAGEDPEMMESSDGGCIAFVSGGRLFMYNESAGKLACAYSFYDYGAFDVRNINDKHDIRILQVADNGDMVFAVYGYMNRGRHEGDIGIAVYSYDDKFNEIRELLYIPYDKSADILMEEMKRLLYMNSQGHIYMTMENCVFRVDLDEKILKTTGMYWSGDTLQTSDDQRFIVTMGDTGDTISELTVTDLETETSVGISAGSSEYIRFLGFLGEDMIYGMVRHSDVQVETSGNLLLPMYRICICDGAGKLIKYYEKEGYYVTDVSIEENRIMLSRLSGGAGAYQVASDDSITARGEDETGRNYLSVAVIDKYERYVQIQTRSAIKVSGLKVTTPSEIISEEISILEPDIPASVNRFYVFDARGICGIFVTESAAVEAAYEIGGTAVEENGNVIWKYASRKNVNQILEIKGTGIDEGESSLSVCMDVMMGYEGVIRNSEVLLASGSPVSDILSENMDNVTVLDLTGCTIDQLYFYLDNDIPVMALLQSGGALLIAGHNDKELVIMDPATGELVKKDIEKMRDFFENNGNQFITYAYSGAEVWARECA